MASDVEMPFQWLKDFLLKWLNNLMFLALGAGIMFLVMKLMEK